jgi:hypothetical protein
MRLFISLKLFFLSFKTKNKKIYLDKFISVKVVYYLFSKNLLGLMIPDFI